MDLMGRNSFKAIRCLKINRRITYYVIENEIARRLHRYHLTPPQKTQAAEEAL
jgi:hypothetical protein